MMRPKVRFIQSHELVTEQKDHEAKELKNVTCSKGKVRVKSIVPANFPMKILENGQRVLVKERIQEIDANKLKNSRYMPSIYVSEKFSAETEIESRKSSITDESEITFSDVQSCIDEIQKMNIKESHNSSSDVLKNIVPITLTDGHEDNDIEFIEVVKKHTNSKIKKNCKEYKVASDKSTIDSNFISASNCKRNTNKTTKKENKENCSKYMSVKYSTNKSPLSKKIVQEATNSSDKAPHGTIAKKLSKSQKPMQLMPCDKFKFATSSNKNKVTHKKSETQVKKSTVFHVMGNNNNISVEAGALRKNNKFHTDIIYNDKNIISNDLLTRPEYNSMIGVMKNLKEIENEKLVKDYEHLPKVYQNFISEKVTAALDFSPYETVYKDLIDLSIDDDKLPTRLMRSKDPEPRDKDIVPKLSDFYNPKYAEQYFTTVNPKPLNPINLNTLNAFTISNKVCAWKICRDNS